MYQPNNKWEKSTLGRNQVVISLHSDIFLYHSWNNNMLMANYTRYNPYAISDSDFISHLFRSYTGTDNDM